MNSVIGICDSNAVYMKKLAESFMRKSDIPLQIMTFSDCGQLIEYLKEHSLDVLIADGVIFREYFNQDQSVDAGRNMSQQMEVINRHTGYIVELSDEKGGMEKSGEFVFRISRYQSSAELFSLIRPLLMKSRMEEDQEPVNQDAGYQNAGYQKTGYQKTGYQEERKSGYRISVDTQEVFKNYAGCIITVFSPINRCGKTSLAVLLTELLNQREASLMICMDHYAGIFSAEEQNLAELIYRMSGENNLRIAEENVLRDFAEYESYVKIWEKVSYISASKTVEDLVQISAVQLCRLLDMLKYRSRYRYIVVDLSEGMENLHEVLDRSDFIFMPMLDDCVSRCKMEMFDQHMQSVMEPEKYKSLFARIHRMQMPAAFEAENTENYYRELIWSNQAKAAEGLLEQYCI